MNSFYNLILITSCCLILASCGNNSNKNHKGDISLTKIAIEDSLNLNTSLSDLGIKDIEYVILETSDICLLKENPDIYLTDSLIITIAREEPICLFNRKDGKFIRKIGNRDHSHEGYREVTHSYPFDENAFFVKGWKPNEYKLFDYKGNLIKSIELEGDSLEAIMSYAYLNDSVNIGYVWNFNGKQKNKIKFFEKNGRCSDNIPQTDHFDWNHERDGFILFRWECWMYRYDDKLFFLENTKDTIFQIDKMKAIPKYVFTHGKWVREVFETNRILMFQFNFDEKTGVYDKKSRRLLACDRKSGFINDIDNFINFSPFSMNKHEEMVGIVPALDLVDWFDKNTEQAQEIAPRLKKLKSIKETDNPVVMIARF